MIRGRGGRSRLPPGRIVGAFGIALLAAAVRPDRASADPLVAVYDASWAGLPAARIRVEFNDGGTYYRNSIQISTEGLPRLVTHFRGHATAEGRLESDRPAEPLRYDAVYDLRKRRNSHISMRFVARGQSTVAERGPGDTSRRAQLGEPYRRDAVDPLSAFERIREALRAALHADRATFVVPVYDGARRFDVKGRVLPRSNRDGHSLQVALVLRPIAGFKGETSEDGDPDDAPRPARLTVSDDARLLPLAAEVRVYYLPLVVRLDHLCPGRPACAP
jgi:hypothetical protein